MKFTFNFPVTRLVGVSVRMKIAVLLDVVHQTRYTVIRL